MNDRKDEEYRIARAEKRIVAALEAVHIEVPPAMLTRIVEAFAILRQDLDALAADTGEERP